MVLVNKGFNLIHEKFTSKGWELKENNQNNIIYVDPINENDRFCIDINKNNIDVSVPIPNSNVEYRTTLNNYFETCEYLEMHLNNFMETENRFLRDNII